MLKTINLKEIGSVESACAILDLELERVKLEGVSVIKLIHGYGSHGVGGDILREIRRKLLLLKKKGKIKNYLIGNQWNLFNKEVAEILQRDKSISGDEDLNRNNPGITIVEV